MSNDLFDRHARKANLISLVRIYSSRPMLVCLIAMLALLAPIRSDAQIDRNSLGSLGNALGLNIGNRPLADSEGLDQQDMEHIGSGQLLKVKRKYESMPQESLTMVQQRLLCDLQLGFGQTSVAEDCLERLLVRVRLQEPDDAPELVPATLGRITLLKLAAARFVEAAELSAELESDGGRYLFALASAKSGDEAAAIAIAESFARSHFYPRLAFFAANIWLALDRCDKSLEILLSPRTRLARDYGLKSSTGALGNRVNPATFRMDLFEDVEFGLFDGFSYAPKANQYVEFVTAYCMIKTEQVDEGRERLMLVLNDPETQSMRDVLWVTQYELAKLASASGDRHSAEQYLLQAMSNIEEMRSSIVTDAVRIGVIPDKFSVYERMLELQYERGEHQLALETLERAKARTLVDLLSEQDDLKPAISDSPDGLVLLDEMLTKQAIIASRTSDNRQEGQEHSLQQTKSQLTKTAPRLGALVSVTHHSYQQLASQLAMNELYLLYHQFGHSLYAIVLGEGQATVQLLDSNGLNSEIELFRREIAQADHDRYRDTAARLYDRLVRPLEIELADATRVTIVPTAALYYLPFSALSDGERFLVERVPLRILPSLTTLQLIDKNRSNNSSLLILGNPGLRDPRFDLPETELETRSLANHPLLSRLLLASTPDADGHLTSSELYGLRLQADLVVLSASGTGMSSVVNGDDMIGLMTGFLYAGAKGVVGSLWPVSDEATDILMVELYRQLDGGREPSHALRDAQLLAIKNSPHPFYWAAFFYYGEDKPLQKTTAVSR